MITAMNILVSIKCRNIFTTEKSNELLEKDLVEVCLFVTCTDTRISVT